MLSTLIEQGFKSNFSKLYGVLSSHVNSAAHLLSQWFVRRVGGENWESEISRED